jgi:hypothetical protein
MEKVQNTVILCVMHHRQNPLESTHRVGLDTIWHPEAKSDLISVGRCIRLGGYRPLAKEMPQNWQHKSYLLAAE